ncbi:hypothetical protein EYF80_037256 [Liparis tanakae]|uniref:Uncharacterized protein n=1 Tax=Liparis tanakae TaxID=230148 RepID=A0A4Z2GGL1_9TELE|nr:hypothetical protein EYF80_037256 [Liparis tanakae]
MLGPARYFRLRNRKYFNLLSGSDYATSYSPVHLTGDFLFAPLRDAYRQNDMPRLNGWLRLPDAAGTSHRSAVRSARLYVIRVRALSQLADASSQQPAADRSRFSSPAGMNRVRCAWSPVCSPVDVAHIETRKRLTDEKRRRVVREAIVS